MRKVRAENVICQIDKNIILAQYEPTPKKTKAVRSEQEMENDFIHNLCNVGYSVFTFNHSKTHEDQLLDNLKEQMEWLNRDVLNNKPLTEAEWEDFKTHGLLIGTYDRGIEKKAERLHSDARYTITLEETGKPVNLKIIDKEYYQNNRYQVVHQYEEERGDHPVRYDVTLLVNGLPLVHIELKKPGVRIRDAFNQINRYSTESFDAGQGIFEWVQIFVISNGTKTKYYANTVRKIITDNTSKKVKRASYKFTTYWADEKNRHIDDLTDFTKYFLSSRVLWSILTKYCVFNTEKTLLVMRPYQICAVERSLNRIEMGKGGYVWHTTGSGKTLTSFKLAQLARFTEGIDKVLFVVDRRDLDYQAQQEYDNFEKGSANGTKSGEKLRELMTSQNSKIIITTINKLSEYLNKSEKTKQRMVLIFDECHRSTFGMQFETIKKKIPNSIRIGFTGTPIFVENAVKGGVHPTISTTPALFGDQIHQYTIVNAIADHNVLPFKVDYIDTIKENTEKEDNAYVKGIDKKKATLAKQRIVGIAEDILHHFNKKTQNKKYSAILATESIEMAMAYYEVFRKLDPDFNIKRAMIYTYNKNDDYDEENMDELDEFDQIPTTSREALEKAIVDYNKLFGTQFTPNMTKEYFKDVTRRLRLKDKDKQKANDQPLDLVIVVNMMLTGYDAKTLNTLYVDKDLHHHLLLQAFSRTNRIMNESKTHGNIICYRNLKNELMDALKLFGASEHSNTIILRTFDEYYKDGYTIGETKHRSYIEIVNDLLTKYPLTWFTNPVITNKEKGKFVDLFSKYLRTKHILESYDEFYEPEIDKIITEAEEQNYKSRYLDIYDELKPKRSEKEDIRDSLDFCMELVNTTEVTVDYIVDLLAKKSEGKDRELTNDEIALVLGTPEARPKKELIEAFVKQISSGKTWETFNSEKREKELTELITKFKLKPQKTKDVVNEWFKRDTPPVIDGYLFAQLIESTPKGMGMLTGQQKRNELKNKFIEEMEMFYKKFTV